MSSEETRVANGISHFDIVGRDEEALHRFYAEVFGWQVDSGPGFALVRTPAGSPDGAIAEGEEPSLTVGVTVPDLDAALAAATEAGGGVAMPATDNGWVVKGEVTDPVGNRVTLIQS